MRTITVYDTEADAIERLADCNDMTTAEVVEMLMEYKDEMCEGNNLQEV